MKWRGANLCLGRDSFVVQEGVFLNWKDTVKFMLWMTICVLEGIYRGGELKRCGLNYG